MLRNDFYTLSDLQVTDQSVEANVNFNPEHSIFKGHFPEMPIVPGVCMVEIVKEAAEICTKTSLRLSSATSIKFLSVIDPRKTNKVVLKLQLRDTHPPYEASATLSKDDNVYFKFSGTFVMQP
ncbi:MAG TPA: hypothetical protein VD927_08905 [Chryseosolibacter sp.]|nr:hypothetical protein [Chryseosolibacter sp.]